MGFSKKYIIKITKSKKNMERGINDKSNDLVTLEYEKNNKSVLLGTFTNSFGNDSVMLLSGYKIDKNNNGKLFNISNGYRI